MYGEAYLSGILETDRQRGPHLQPYFHTTYFIPENDLHVSASSESHHKSQA
jgi:hypothetical protein